MAYTKYSLTPADNNAAPPNGAPEGMLPSAVNDTMRDMMSQVRDVGDGIRNGTYTMTAPVITGGSITGVALSGNTLTNPAITGGSINNTPIGASTANTGNFTTLGASSTATLNTLVSSGATITGGSISGVSLSATSPNFTTPILGTPTSGTLTNCTGLPVATGVSGLGSNVATFLATPSSANLASAVTDETGTGALVFANSPALTTPNLGTPSAATLTNATGLPVATGISGLGTGVATFLATPSSANLKTAVTDETGSGALVFATSPTLVTPVLGVATATSVQGIIGNVTPAAGTFTTLTANGNTTLGDAAGDITTVPDLKALQVTSADRHSVRPSLLLDFANTKTLDPRITFTRASTASFYDGKTVAKAEENLVTFSQEFDNAGWEKVGNQITVTANSETAPDGTTTADTLAQTAITNHFIAQQTITLLANTNYVLSAYVKNVDIDYVVLELFGATSNYAYAEFNLTTGAVSRSAATGTGWSVVSSAITSVGNSWYRASVIITTGTSVSVPRTRLMLSDGTTAVATNGTIVFTGTNKSAYFWGAQLEQRSSVTAYTATTTAPITNYIPALQSAASGVARFEHNPITGESLGLEIEEQRTNLFTYSEQFDNAAWTKVVNTVTANSVVSPNGDLTADSLVTGSSSAAQGVVISASHTSGTFYTQSVYAKANGFNFIQVLMPFNSFGINAYANFDLSTGTVGTVGSSSTATITSVGNGWYRCSTTAQCTTTTTSSGGFYIASASNAARVPTITGNGFSGVHIWGAQLEAGAFATSYIPTVASQVTRSADAASMTGTNFSSWFNPDAGTLYTQFQFNGAPLANGGVASINNNTTSVRYLAAEIGTNNALLATSTPGFSSATLLTMTVGSKHKIAMSVSPTQFAFSLNGAAATQQSGSRNATGLNQIEFGGLANQATRNLNVHISKVSFYPTNLTTAELSSLTVI